MKELCHTNVIKLQHAFYTQGDKVSQSNFSKLFLTISVLINSKMRST